MSGLSVWVVYDHPSDFPNCYVARQWIGDKPGRVLVSNALEPIQTLLEGLGLVHMDRMEGDDPVILETWI
jgi:hypothetical protein